MNKLWLLLLLVIPYQSIHAQEVKHAPTVEQCRADQKLWWSKLEQAAPSGVANVSFVELADWAGEMADCRSVDPGFAQEYHKTDEEAISTALVRMTHFLDRHNLLSQFVAEDAQGKGR